MDSNHGFLTYYYTVCPPLCARLLGSVARASSWEVSIIFEHHTVQTVNDRFSGALGDCWLMAAMACMAEVIGGIDNLFITKEFDPRGMYTIQLFDGTADSCRGAWRKFTIDDYIPCDRRQWNNGNGRAVPKFSQPNGNELWVMLLEKAFAKLCGSYKNLEGGSTIWALRAMTGIKFCYSLTH